MGHSVYLMCLFSSQLDQGIKAAKQIHLGAGEEGKEEEGICCIAGYVV